MNSLEKAELSASAHQTEIFSKSEITIYNLEAPGTAGRKSRRILTNASRYALKKLGH